MTATSAPIALEHNAGIAGLAVAMVLIGLGVGGVLSTIGPFIGACRRSCGVGR
jgi:proton-dependent oligopeptide transporter, POT family